MAKITALDRVISYLNPKAGALRARYRKVESVLRETDKRRYAAASVSRRTDGWIATETSPNAEIAPSLHRLRARSRDLVRNNGYASRAIQVILGNVVGAGIIPQPQDPTIDNLWNRWGDALSCDVQ